MNYDPNMVPYLEERNDILRKENEELKKKLKNSLVETDRFRRAGTFYMRMQQLIMTDENIGAAWDEFYTLMALCAPNIRKISEEL